VRVGSNLDRLTGRGADVPPGSTVVHMRAITLIGELRVLIERNAARARPAGGVLEFAVLDPPTAPVSEAGIASSLLNVGQQIGASLGVAGLGTLAWTVIAGRLGGDRTPTSGTYRHALAAGFDRGFLVTAGALLAAVHCALLTSTPQAVETAEAAQTEIPIETRV
jgi:hypothetical protein